MNVPSEKRYEYSCLEYGSEQQDSQKYRIRIRNADILYDSNQQDLCRKKFYKHLDILYGKNQIYDLEYRWIKDNKKGLLKLYDTDKKIISKKERKQLDENNRKAAIKIILEEIIALDKDSFKKQIFNQEFTNINEKYKILEKNYPSIVNVLLNIHFPEYIRKIWIENKNSKYFHYKYFKII